MASTSPPQHQQNSPPSPQKLSYDPGNNYSAQTLNQSIQTLKEEQEVLVKEFYAK